MALFRKFFYRKPPDGLLEISERVYVFDCCFTTDTFEDDEYKVYIGGIVNQLRDHFPDASFMVFNFREGENQSQIASILSEYDMTVMDYPRHYEGCPLLTMEMIHHFLRSSESWLSLGQQNVLLMHCERGGWPVLSFMLAALLIYRKQFTSEQKTQDMIYKQAPRELLQLMSALNPLPSQLRYLQYVSRRNVASEWPPLDRALTLDCIILRVIPNLDGEGGCRPIFRIYGQDPFMAADRTPKVLFSTPKKSNLVRHYKQADCELVKIDIHCHVQGDVVMECISLDSDQEREQMMFRVMFNTAFIRSNILMLNRDEIDTLWNLKDQFPKDFRAEVLFSEMNSASSLASIDLLGLVEKDGLPVDAFAKVHEIFSNVDWLETKTDVGLNMFQHITELPENLDNFPKRAELGIVLLESTLEKVQVKPKLNEDENKIGNPTPISVEKQSLPSFESSPDANSIGEKIEPQELKVSLHSMLSIKPSPDANSIMEKVDPQELEDCLQSVPSIKPSRDENSIQKKVEPQELQVTLQRPTQSKIISQRIPQTSLSSPVSYSNSLQGSPVPISRYHSAPSALGITALLHDHAAYNGEEIMRPVTLSLPSSAVSSPITNVPKPVKLNNVCTLRQPPLPPPLRPPPQRPPPPVLSLQSSLGDPTTTEKISAAHLIASEPISKATNSLLNQHQEASSGKLLSSSVPPPPPPPPSLSGSSVFPAIKSFSSTPPTPPPPPSFSRASSSPTVKKPFSTPLPPSPLASFAGISLASTIRIPHSTPPPPPPPPRSSQSTKNLAIMSEPPLPPPPPPLHSWPVWGPISAAPVPPPAPPHNTTPKDSSNVASVPTLPLPPNTSPKDSSSNNSSNVPHVPPPPPPPNISSQDSSSNNSSNVPHVPPPPPPPSTALKDSSSDNSSNVPPVPPPPAPFAKGLSKVNGACLHSHSGLTNGNVPPVPGPPSSAPLSVKGRGMLRTNPRNQVQPRKANLKPYHWLKLTRAMHGSIWAEAQKSDEASKAPEFDMSELESLFSAAAPPNSDHGSTAGKANRRISGPKSDKIHLIELRRAYNCEIMLSKVKIPLPDLMSSVLALDDSALDVDQVDNLIKFCPTKEEIELLKGYNGDKENLGKCEQFFLEMMKVPRVESKLRVFSFKLQFYHQVSDLRRNLKVVNSASEEIRSSIKLKRIMQAILSLGNALNHGTARGSAIGFRLDSLLKLTDTRAHNNKMTLMHYLCKVLAEKLPELLDFPKDLMSLETATKIQLKYLAEEMQAISKGLEKVVQELTASENDGPVSANFCETLKAFLGHAESEVRPLASLYSTVGRNADALALYFGEDPARCPFEQVVSTLLNFVRMFVRAHEENCKQLEFEKKKAERDAENEKPKMGASKRESINLVRTPVRNGDIK